MNKTRLYFWTPGRQIFVVRVVFTIAAMFGLLRAACAESALDALKQLPVGAAARIARIEGRGGMPEPDRWYILTQDPTDPNGLHEFVVSNGEIVASRSISQFADTLKPEDMLGSAPLNIDSDKAAKMARGYAEANGAVVASINYELKKDGTDAAPTWTISCLDDKGTKVGAVIVTAGKGSVVSHDGFPLEPPKPDSTPKNKTDEPRFETYAKPEVAPTPAPSPSPEEAGRHHHHASAKKSPSALGKAIRNVGHTLQKWNPF